LSNYTNSAHTPCYSGYISRYRARQVAKGYSQWAGVDYTDTYSPVVRLTSLRLLMSLAQTRKMKITHVDVVSAFLHADIDQDVYMEIPPGWEECTSTSAKSKGRLVCKLKRSIYGLHQSSRCWFQKLQLALERLGFRRLETEPCIFIKDGCIICVFVDDLYLCSR